MPDARCTRGSRVQKKHGMDTSNRLHRNDPAFPHALGFNGFLRALVSRKSARMSERAVLTNRPFAGSEPVRAQRPQEPDGERGTDPVSSSTRTVAWALSPNRARKGAG